MKANLHKKILIVLAGCITILIAASGIAYHYLFSHPFRINATKYIYIDKDDTADSVFYKIDRTGNPASIKGFMGLSAYKKYPDKIKTGRYAIRPDDTMFHLFRRIFSGQQTPLQFSINNIRTKEKLASVVSRRLMLDSVEVVSRLNDSVYCAQLGYNKETILSLFIPNTYEMYWNITMDDFFARMQREHTRFWNQKRLQKAAEIGFSPLEVSILASIVDEETNYNPEKATIAGLYINRLRRGMPLQADPTIKFALQDFGLKRITGEHLQICSPYNTYINKGLPPGPIRIPSITGIDSVLNYAHHNYIYMCAKEDFSGTHNFASNFAQHQANARKYWKALNNRKIHS